MNTPPAKFAIAVLAALSFSGCAPMPMPIPAGEPVLDVSPVRHGNLAAAQQFVRQAYDRLGDAQDANHGELGGHAARAKELLHEANEEIKLAAIAANRR